ncbi:MAG TPA: hypothetical protein VIM69_14035, partial [Opitutaceae bacterium]
MKVRFFWLAFFVLLFARYADASAFTTSPPSTVAPSAQVTIAGNTSAVNPPNQGVTILILWWQTPDGVWHNQGMGSGASGTISGSITFTFTSATGPWHFAIGGYLNGQPAQGAAPSGSYASATTTVGIPITAATINSLTYNGSAQSPTSVSSVSPAGATVTVTAAAQTNANTYYTATVTGTGSYIGTLTNVAWTINKANQGTVSISPTSALIVTGRSGTFTGSGGSTGSYVWGGTSGATGSGATANVT